MKNNEVKHRFLPLETALNVRDLGGYTGHGGKTVKWNTIFRSGDFPALSSADKNLLEQKKIISLVDFRSSEEIEQNPDCLLSSVKFHKYLSAESGNLVPDFIKLSQIKDQLSESELTRKGDDLMKSLYINLVSENAHIYKGLFELLQQKKTPVLFHCSAGKDRTGIAAALILYSLGVSMEDIYTDYELTNVGLQNKYEGLSHDFGPLISYFKTVKPEFLSTALDWVTTKYGSINSYLKTVLNVDIELMRILYLE